MPERYSRVNLGEVEDAAPANGFADRWQARVARAALSRRELPISGCYRVSAPRSLIATPRPRRST